MNETAPPELDRRDSLQDRRGTTTLGQRRLVRFSLAGLAAACAASAAIGQGWPTPPPIGQDAPTMDLPNPSDGIRQGEPANPQSPGRRRPSVSEPGIPKFPIHHGQPPAPPASKLPSDPPAPPHSNQQQNPPTPPADPPPNSPPPQEPPQCSEASRPNCPIGGAANASCYHGFWECPHLCTSGLHCAPGCQFLVNDDGTRFCCRPADVVGGRCTGEILTAGCGDGWHSQYWPSCNG